jgi:AcrR family transcriptional regulator
VIQTPEHIDKKEAILVAAEELFSDQDFDAVSVRDLAKKANVNIAMISYYFGSKEKLLEELIASKIETSQIALRQISADGMNPWDKMQAIVNLYVDKLTANRKFQRVVTRELSSNVRPQLRETMMAKMRVNREFIKGIIQEGIDQKMFRKDVDLQMVMMSMFATITHLIGTSHYACEMFEKKTEEDLFTDEFRERVKKYFRDTLANYLLIKK